MTRTTRLVPAGAALALALFAAYEPIASVRQRPNRGLRFELQEATLEGIQSALKDRRLTTVELVHLYLSRIKAYNGPCVSEPEGILGPIVPIPAAGHVNALATLNLRPSARRAMGFDDRKARSLTDANDESPAMPDALEFAAEQDRRLARTGRLAGPLHGAVLAIKDQFDTFDLRTTRSEDVLYANDRPPDDATFVRRLREAGAIILAKANMSVRSSFGGTVCNPYDTERSPGNSSSGAAASVAANLVTCAIGEETGISIRGPAQANSLVGLAPTQELTSRDGMIGAGITTRVGPICRTVEDAARLLDVIAGYDPKDPLTVFSVGRKPAQPYHAFTREARLDGLRIGVVREYMEKGLFGELDADSLEIADRAVRELRSLGADIVDPGPEGALFQACINKHGPEAANKLFATELPDLFPVDSAGEPTTDHIGTLADLALDPSRVPDAISIRSFGSAPDDGERAYMIERYLRERGDPAIRTAEDHATKANVVGNSRSGRGRRSTRVSVARELDMSRRMLQRFAVQQTVLQCMTALRLDAVVYASSNIPPMKLGAPEAQPTRSRPNWELNTGIWTFFGHHGFPAITVPAGFTTRVYDHVVDRAASGGTRLIGPTPARLPVGIDIVTRPFDEPLLLRIAAAYQRRTNHRRPPAGFGPLTDER